MVSSLRPQDYKKMEDYHVYHNDKGRHGNHRISRYRPYSQARIDRLKFALVVLNTLFFTLGSIALGLSVYGLIRYEILGYKDLFESVMMVTVIPWIAAVASTLSVTMVLLCGCHGAVAQRTGMLVCFFLYLFLMLLLDLVMCIWIATTADKIQTGIEVSIRTGVETYRTNHATKFAIDDLQTNLGCCGADYGILDYGLRGAPPSCTHQYLFTPCNTRMSQIYKEYRFIAVGALGGLALVLMIGLIIIIMLIGAIKRRRPPRPPVADRPRPEITVVDATNNIPTPPPPPPLPPPLPKSPTKSGVGGAKVGGINSGVVLIANANDESSIV